MHKNHFRFSLLLALLPFIVHGQTTREEFFSDIRHSSGIYQPYIFVPSPSTPAPDGYKPFYISHYGRHGSRWLTSPYTYSDPLAILTEAREAGKLTPHGESLYQRVKAADENARARYGDLSGRGAIEHKGIAERMFYSFPEIFSTKDGRECNIYCRSTTVPRCILSMAANNERLKELNPAINIKREASDRNNYLNNYFRISNRDSVSVLETGFLEKNLDAGRFISSVFTDTLYSKVHRLSPLTFMDDVYAIASDIRDIEDLDFTMDDLFTDDELFVLWQASNFSHYLHLTGKVPRDSSKLLLRNILDCADSAIKNNNISADLRFGHDSYITPLLALMDINGPITPIKDMEKVYTSWCDFKVTPMGTNLQLIFFRNDKTGDVIVKILHCEREAAVPVATDIAPYYHWKDLRAYYEAKLGR